MKQNIHGSHWDYQVLTEYLRLIPTIYTCVSWHTWFEGSRWYSIFVEGADATRSKSTFNIATDNCGIPCFIQESWERPLVNIVQRVFARDIGALLVCFIQRPENRKVRWLQIIGTIWRQRELSDVLLNCLFNNGQRLMTVKNEELWSSGTTILQENLVKPFFPNVVGNPSIFLKCPNTASRCVEVLNPWSDFAVLPWLL